MKADTEKRLTALEELLQGTLLDAIVFEPGGAILAFRPLFQILDPLIIGNASDSSWWWRLL